jgi:integrase/recombinase XerD
MPSSEARAAATGEIPRLIDRFLDHLAVERGVAQNTRNAYTRDLSLYLEGLGDREITRARAITERDIGEFISALREREYAPGKRYSPATVARVLAAVRGFHRWMLREGLTAVDAAEPIGSMRIPRALPKALSLEEVVALIEAVPSEGVPAMRDRAILEMLYAAGLRISELTALDVDDVDLDARLVRCFGKGSKERVVPVGRTATGVLDTYLRQSRPMLAKQNSQHALFLNQRGTRLTRQGCWKLLKRYAIDAQMTRRISPHTLRHSFATHLIDGGADVRVVQELLGHASVSTTQVYMLTSPEKLREVYDNAHPRARRSARRP